MIFTDRKITIRNGKSMINEPVILYRGDYEVSIRFTIMESKFRFKSGVNLVDSEKASHGQLAILTPYGGNVFSEIVKCEDGTVTFTLTKEMIDQLEEVGLYSFQIRLFDYYRESRVSIPPVEFGIEVREPVASEDHDNTVNNAIVGYSIAKVVDGLKEDVPDTFDDNGNYNKTDWETGDRISEGKLNKIEDAIDKINQNEKNDIAAMDKKVNSNYNVLRNEIEATDDALTIKLNAKADVSYVNSKVNAVASGSPKGVYATVAALTSAIPKGNSNIYVVSADGCWYYWNGSEWTNGGVYQDTKIADNIIKYKNFNSTLQTQVKRTIVGEYLPADSNLIYDVDTTNQVIRIYLDGSRGPAFNGSNLEKNVVNTLMGNTSGVDPIELSYANIGSSAIQVCYDLTTNQYFLLRYSQTVPEECIRVAMVRAGTGNTTPYGDSHLVTHNGGRPGRQLQNQIEKGELRSTYFVKRIWQSRYNSTALYNYKMIVDIDTRTITIPASEFIYGKTSFQVKEPYTIQYKDMTSLVYIFFNTTTKLFEAHGYSHINRKDIWDKPDDLLLYDVYRIPSRRFIFEPDEVVTLRSNSIKYFKVNELLDFRHSVVATECIAHPTSGVVFHFHKFDNNDGMFIPCRRPNDTSIDYNTQGRIAAASNEFNHSNMARISKSDNISNIFITNPYDNYVCALQVWAITEDGFKSVTDAGWVYNTTNPVNSSDRYTTGRYLEVNMLFEKAKVKFGVDFEYLFVIGLMAKRDSTPIEDLSEASKLHFPIEVNYNSVSHNKGELSNQIAPEEIEIIETTNKEFRARYFFPMSIDGLDYIQVRVKNHKITVGNITAEIRTSIHYTNTENSKIHDTNWFYKYRYGMDTPLEYEVSALNSWCKRYEASIADSIIDRYSKITGALIYIGATTTTDTLTTDVVRQIVDQLEISYEVHNIKEEDFEKLYINNHTKKEMLLNVFKQKADTNNSISSALNLSTYSSTTTLTTMSIPKEAKGFLVEFRAKVSGDMGSVTFANSTYRMTVVNNGMKAFKMRFNKSDIAQLTGDVTVTPPTGGTITVQGLKVIPVYEEVPTSNHINAQFYLHRGYSSVYPENTLLAVEEACKRGCSIVEIDTFSSTDNKTLICHDTTLGRTNKEYPTRQYTDITKFNMYSTSAIQVDPDLISKFALHEQLTITDNGVDKTAYINTIDTARNVITLSINNLTGPITSIQSSGVYVGRCSEAEFLQYEVGAYKNPMFEGELNASFEDYIKVCRRYNAALLLDIRIMTEANFKGQIAQLLDKYDYWDKCYFMHNISSCNKYHQWATDIDRKIVITPILWTTGDTLTNDIQTFGSTNHPNASRKDVVFQSSAVTEENVALAHSLGMRVHVFTVNSIAEAQRVLRMGVDIVGGDYFSDDTAILW